MSLARARLEKQRALEAQATVTTPKAAASASTIVWEGIPLDDLGELEDGARQEIREAQRTLWARAAQAKKDLDAKAAAPELQRETAVEEARKQRRVADGPAPAPCRGLGARGGTA